MPGIFDRVIVLNLLANTAIFYVAARLICCLWFRMLNPNKFSCPFCFCRNG
jgi:hypothetical protein